VFLSARHVMPLPIAPPTEPGCHKRHCCEGHPYQHVERSKASDSASDEARSSSDGPDAE